MLWSKPSWLSRDGKVGLEVIYSEETPHREVTHLTTWKTPCTHITPSNPLATSMREDNHGGGLGYCECVGGWGKGWGALAPFSPLSPLPSRYTCLHLSRAWGGGKQSEMGDLQGSISKFVSSRIPNHNPIQDPLFSPSVFFPHRLSPTFSSLSTRLAPPAQNFRIIVSGLVLSEDKGPTFIFGF